MNRFVLDRILNKCFEDLVAQTPRKRGSCRILSFSKYLHLTRTQFARFREQESYLCRQFTFSHVSPDIVSVGFESTYPDGILDNWDSDEDGEVEHMEGMGGYRGPGSYIYEIIKRKKRVIKSILWNNYFWIRLTPTEIESLATSSVIESLLRNCNLDRSCIYVECHFNYRISPVLVPLDLYVLKYARMYPNISQNVYFFIMDKNRWHVTAKLVHDIFSELFKISDVCDSVRGTTASESFLTCKYVADPLIYLQVQLNLANMSILTSVKKILQTKFTDYVLLFGINTTSRMIEMKVKRSKRHDPMIDQMIKNMLQPEMFLSSVSDPAACITCTNHSQTELFCSHDCKFSAIVNGQFLVFLDPSKKTSFIWQLAEN